MVRFDSILMGLRRRRLSSQSSSESLLASTEREIKANEQVKIRYAKRKKPDNLFTKSIQLFGLLCCVYLCYIVYYHFDWFHLKVVHFYADKMDDQHAQHALGHKLLKDGSNLSPAFYWFRKSAQKGHPQSVYNLAVGHLSGYRTDVKKGEVKELLEFAAKNNVEEARILLVELCDKKPDYCQH